MQGIVVDLFAGGGGASTGVEAALGRAVDVAVNHDPVAIACHLANHPRTRHYLTSVFDVDPREAADGRPVDVLWASPDCTHFSRAKGAVPRSKNIRSLAWVVTDWAEQVRPRLIFMENVPEFRDWGPLDDVGHPCPDRRGDTFREFVGRLEGLGYRVEHRVLTACDYGAPTRRPRLFLVARCDGEPIVWPEPTHGPGRGLPYHTAAECIDWSIPCPSIFLTPAEVKARGLSCKRPLAEKTMGRIAEGVRRFVLEAGDDAFVVKVNHGGPEARTEDAGEPLTTIVASRRGHAVVVPTLVQTGYGEREGQAPRVPGLGKPLGTVVSGGQKHAVVAAFLSYAQQGGANRSIEQPFHTITASRKDQNCIIAASMVTLKHGETPVSAVDAPARVICAQGTHQALVSALLTKHYGGVVGHTVEAPVGTITAVDHHAVTTATLSPSEGGRTEQVRAFLVKFYGQGGQLSAADQPMHTLTAKHRMGLVTVHGVEYQIVDIGMRMLEPHELLRAQFGRFADGYRLDVEKRVKARKVGISKADKVRLIGNSVPPEMAEAVVRANVPAEVMA